MRRGLAAICAGLVLLLAGPAAAGCSKGDGAWIARACYAAPLDPPQYRHGALGGTPEWTRLVLDLGPRGRAGLNRPGGRWELALPSGHIFEDTAPRVVAFDRNGPPRVVVVETDLRLGARLAVVDPATGRLDGLAYAGRPNRWLAPVGAADLDGDGQVEIAFVLQPHLAKRLVVAGYVGGRLVVRAQTGPLTNHRFGMTGILGGIRDCGGRPEMVLARGDWSGLVAVGWDGRRFEMRALGTGTAPADFARAMGC